jgi:uncharacterized phage protein gp47/JayE
MSVSILDLLTVETKDVILDKFVTLLRIAGFPTASWQTASFMRHTVEGESSLLVDLATSVQKIGLGGYIKYAGQVSDDWVDLLGENVFSEERKAAVYTRGKVRLTDSAAVGPVTINDSSFWVANADKTLRFRNVEAGVVPLNGYVDLTFEAETAGVDWNVGNLALTEVLTPIPGVTMSNPSLDTGTWITQQGADKESNDRYAARCLDKWAQIGSGADEAGYRYRAASSSAEITRVRPYSPGAGAVRVVVAGDSGPVSTAALALADTAVLSRRPLGVPDILTLNAGVNAQSVVAVLAIELGRDPAGVISAAQKAVNAFARTLDIGAKKVSREKIIRALDVDGVTDLEMSAPATDFALLDNEIWVPTFLVTTAAS